ncbi:Hypothetical Protein OBI_RACECAR_8 [Arthrobacter phage Racecar]|nr:hypothetical protein PBI_RACECAR_89 [Arthrobacter phage Racecar]QFG12767.1 hypothetical protein PBI_MIMI_87 [Arthrobacter phage Mimi]
MPDLQVGDRVYERRWYKRIGTIGHILEDREKYGAPYSVTFDDPPEGAPGRDYFAADELDLVVPSDYQTPAEKELREQLAKVEEYVRQFPFKADTAQVQKEWEEGVVLAQSKVRRDIEEILHRG